MKQEGKEQLVNSTLESFNGIDRAEVSPFLYEKILHRLDERKRTIKLSPPAMWRIAACLFVLIGLNIFSIIHLNKSGHTEIAGRKAFAVEYFSFLNSNDL